MAGSRSRPSPDPVAGVAARLRAWLAPGQRLCIAYSGGRDSTALLHMAAAVAPQLGLEIIALHVDHGLSPNAGDWAAFCAGQCRQLAIPLLTSRVRVDPQPGEGLEAAARRARYAAFAACGADAIALAHHAGDQAETMLFRLLRGSSVAGAAGMPVRRPLARPDGAGDLMLLRPLLDVAPAVLAAHVAGHGLAHIEDESNADRSLSRNYLRHEVLAPLERGFPGATGRLARSAERLREADQLLDALAAIDLEQCRGRRGLRLDRLGELAPARQRNLLHAWLRQQGLGLPSSAWLEELREQLVGGRGDAQTRVSVGTAEIRGWLGEAVLVRPWRGAVDAVGFDALAGEIDWAGGRLTLRHETGVGLALGRLGAGRLRLSRRRGGEHLRPDPRRPTRSLKQLLQEAGIPPWEREVLPCLWQGDELLWVAGIGIAASHAAGPGEPGCVLEWRVPG